MSGRYRIPDPICEHKRKGIVTAGDPKGTGPHAASNVCDRGECIEDAKQWAYASTHCEATHIPDDEKA
jgi:hypothetical protein